MTSSGNVLPMEFSFVPVTYVVSLQHFLVRCSYLTSLDFLNRITMPAPAPAFLSEFLSILTSNGCDGLFGIDTLAKGAWSEIKIGDASAVVPSHGNDHYNENEFIPVALAFDEEKPKFTVHGRCGKNHKYTTKPTH